MKISSKGNLSGQFIQMQFTGYNERLTEGNNCFCFSHSQIKSMATACPEDLTKGNVLAWPDFVAGIVGRVKKDSTSVFCAGNFSHYSCNTFVSVLH